MLPSMSYSRSAASRAQSTLIMIMALLIVFIGRSILSQTHKTPENAVLSAEQEMPAHQLPSAPKQNHVVIQDWPARPEERVQEFHASDVSPVPFAEAQEGRIATPPQEIPPWERNAVKVTFDPAMPRIVIIIDDLGIDTVRTERTVALPGPLTLAYLPYAHNVEEQARLARDAGHELIVHVPMEPINSDLDAGPDVLRVDQSMDEFNLVLSRALEAFDGYVGINNHMGSRLTQDPVAMNRLMETLKSRGLLYCDSRTIHTSIGAETARIHGVPGIKRDVFLDHDPSLAAVRRALEKTERIALKHGRAVAIGHPKDSTIQALREWLPTLKSKNIQLVPVSAVVSLRSNAVSAALPSRPVRLTE